MPVSDEIAFASLRTLGEKLRRHEFSALELTEFFLKRLEILGPRLNAVVTLLAARARAEAAEADRELAAGRDRGPLHGIPYGAKDLLAVRGAPTTWGAEPYRNRVIDHDATVVRRLREAGAVLTAKLAMVEIAGGLGYRQANASLTGPGRNPWDVTRWSGGSSSGSGSAVGGGLVPFALGSETWGSILTPAGYCGIAGLRPTYGRVSRHGAMALSFTLDKLGPMCRTAEDCGLVLAAVAGPDPDDESASDRPFVPPSPKSPDERFRLALLVEPQRQPQEAVRANFERAVESLRAIATFDPIEIPDLPYASVATTILYAEMAAAFEGLIASGDVWNMTAPEDRFGAHAAMLVPAKDYINAFRIRRKIQRTLDDRLAGYDALVLPTLATVAPPIDRDFRDYQAGFRGSVIDGAGNAAGIPALTVPSGFGEGGLPTGIQFVGRAWSEDRLIAVASAYQRLTDWHKRRPPAVK